MSKLDNTITYKIWISMEYIYQYVHAVEIYREEDSDGLENLLED